MGSSGCLARWSLLLQEHNFEIEHRKGSQNIVHDGLSRYNLEELSQEVSMLLEASEFQEEEYLNLVKTIQLNKANLPDLKGSMK